MRIWSTMYAHYYFGRTVTHTFTSSEINRLDNKGTQSPGFQSIIKKNRNPTDFSLETGDCYMSEMEQFMVPVVARFLD